MHSVVRSFFDCATETSYPAVGELVAMMLFHGSDACLAAGYSLLKQTLEHLPAFLQASTDMASPMPLQHQAASSDSRNVDRGLVEKIILGMDGEASRLAILMAAFAVIVNLVHDQGSIGGWPHEVGGCSRAARYLSQLY